MDKLPTTIEALAAMINTHMASKEDIKAVNTRLDGIDSRLGPIEHVLMEEQKRETENLNARVKRLEDAVALETRWVSYSPETSRSRHRDHSSLVHL
jgi:hypothetical protein